ncbi:Flp/Fap pilin component [bacterium YEK0313]|nr:Flp/Fap pilin component [bacterium YEK0313]
MYRLATLFLRDRSGATSIEYGLIAVGIAGAIVAVVYSLGTKVQELFALINERFQ